MGLALSLALAFFFTQGMKNLFGKPRPDMLSRCDPDTSEDAIRRNTVGGGYGSNFNPEWVLVSAAICRSTDKALLDDAFRSFPSGHASSKSLRT
jgi:membrane-associated phospholipid phosphatase